MKRIISASVAFIMMFTLWLSCSTFAFAANQTGKVNCDALNVRSGPGTSYSKVAMLYYGNAVTITGSANDTSNSKWYKISFKSSGTSKTGYVLASYITVTSSGASSTSSATTTKPASTGTTATTTTVLSDSAFENYMTAQGFPDSYKPMLRTMHKNHPKWIFRAQKLNINWSTALQEELVVGRNLVNAEAPASWKSMEKGAYDFGGGYWYGLDGSWVAASRQIISYYLDPRNFLNDSTIFMFENLSYNPSVHNINGVKAILAGSFMSGDYTCPDTKKTYSYAQTFMNSAARSGVSPYHLAEKCLAEQGYNGAPQSLGTVPGYKNYFNFFDINAYYTSTMTAGQMACKYAMTTNPTYYLPWTNQYKSIYGGSIFLGNSYINKEQDTLYLQKFDMVDGGNGYYYHQYMTCVFGHESEAKFLKSAYNQTVLNSAMEFKIPVYNNMPSKLYPKPTSYGDNNNFLKSLSVSGYKLSSGFDKYNMSYELTTQVKDENVTINAVKLGSGATVSGAGKVALAVGTNNVKVNVKAASGVVRTYTIKIVRKPDDKVADVTGFKAESTSDKITLSWTKVSGAQGYVLYQYDTSKKKWERIKVTATNTNTYTVSGLKNASEYIFAIRAYKTVDGKEKLSEKFPVIRPYTKLKAVTGFKGSAGARSAELTWTKLSSADGYVIYQYNNAKNSWDRIEKTASNISSYKAGNLENGVEYTFAIRAYKEVNGSEVLSESFPTVKPITKLDEVANFKGTPAADSVQLTWTKLSAVNGYVIYQYNTAQKKWVRINVTQANVGTYTVSGLKNASQYDFAIRAYKMVNGSEILSESYPTVDPITRLAEVKGFKAESTASTMKLTWVKLSAADGYVIYQYNTSLKKWVRINVTQSNVGTYTVSGLKNASQYDFAIRAYKMVNGREILSESFPVIKVKTK